MQNKLSSKVNIVFFTELKINITYRVVNKIKVYVNNKQNKLRIIYIYYKFFKSKQAYNLWEPKGRNPFCYLIQIQNNSIWNTTSYIANCEIKKKRKLRTMQLDWPQSYSLK